VRAIDTNVVVRLLVRDDEEQGRRAEALFRQPGGVWIALVVLVETVWVLRSAYKFERSAIAQVISALLYTDGVFVEEEQLAQSALTAFEAGTADFADYVILESARRVNALPLWTFDERLFRAKDAERVP
jgi:predicted nucleic-acid-binding protein